MHRPQVAHDGTPPAAHAEPTPITPCSAVSSGRRVLIDDVTRLDGVPVIGVDAHVWRHTRSGDKYVTVIMDLTPVRDGTGPVRLSDVIKGRSKAAFKTWLVDPPSVARSGGGRRDGLVHRLLTAATDERHRRRSTRALLGLIGDSVRLT